MSVPRDYSYSNFKVQNSSTTKTIVARSGYFGTLTIPGGEAGDVLINNGSGEVKWSAVPDLVTTINTGVTPTGIAITQDGSRAYVCNNNNYGATAGNYISVFDLTTNMPLSTISSDTFDQPYTVTLSTDGLTAYITNSAGSTITMIDTSSNEVTGTITGFDGPSGMAIVGTTGYVNNYGASGGAGSGNGTTVSVVNLLTNTILSSIHVGQAPAALALSTDNTVLYVINYVTGTSGTGTMSVVSTVSNTVLHTVSGFFGPFGLAVSSSHAYITNFGSNNFDPFGTTVSVVNLLTNVIETTITVGIQPAGIALSPNGKYVYVSNYNTLYQNNQDFSGLTPGQGTVNVIDTSTNTLLPVTIVVGSSPSNITISPNGQNAYISNFASNTVSVLKVFE
jgi:YVTN family beta-propeller protein